jgi:hypothetical protein
MERGEAGDSAGAGEGRGPQTADWGTSFPETPIPSIPNMFRGHSMAIGPTGRRGIWLGCRKPFRYFVDILLLCKYSSGAPGVTRTRDPRFRKPLLYPTELQAHPIQTQYFARNSRPRQLLLNRESAGKWKTCRLIAREPPPEASVQGFRGNHAPPRHRRRCELGVHSVRKLQLHRCLPQDLPDKVHGQLATQDGPRMRTPEYHPQPWVAIPFSCPDPTKGSTRPPPAYAPPY